MGPQHTMQIAERLYTQGYISYPRTETTHYPENFDLKGALKQQSSNPVWGEEVRPTLVPRTVSPGGEKVLFHQASAPSGEGSALRGLEPAQERKRRRRPSSHHSYESGLGGGAG